MARRSAGRPGTNIRCQFIFSDDSSELHAGREVSTGRVQIDVRPQRHVVRCQIGFQSSGGVFVNWTACVQDPRIASDKCKLWLWRNALEGHRVRLRSAQSARTLIRRLRKGRPGAENEGAKNQKEQCLSDG